jgi:methionine sulfoxide reductase heme-binding subunit
MQLSIFFGSISAHIAATLAAASASQSGALMWYLTRTTAVAAYCVLTVLVGLGLLRSTARRAGERMTWIVDEVHQFLGTIFGVLVGAHLLTLFLDPYIPFTLSNFIVPLNEPYSPLAVDFGVVALWTVVLLLASSWLRRHLPYRFWRALHYLSFATFALVTVHGLFAGSDTSMLWMRAVYAGSAAAIGFLVLVRMLMRPEKTDVLPRRAL